MQVKKLLVVDQDPHVRDLFSEAFASGFDVLATPSLDEAMREATLSFPNCVVLDSALPDRGAFALCKILRSVKETQSIPIILVGEETRDTSWLAAKQMGAFDYLEKPISVDQISEAVQRALTMPRINRRRSKRLSLRIPLVIRGKDVYERDFEMRMVTAEVSRHGFMVRLSVIIPVGEEVEVLRSGPNDPTGASDPARARVVWNDGGGSTGGLGCHGLEFLAPLPEWVPSK